MPRPRSPYELVNGKAHATTAEELKPYYVTAQEARCPGPNGDGSCPYCGGKIHVSFAVLRRFKRVREAYGAPLIITSGFRCNKLQWAIWNATLKRNGGNVAKTRLTVAYPGHSPHEHGEALDVAKPHKFKTSTEWGQFIVDANKGDIRVGAWKYGTFAHMDTMFLVNPAHPAYGKGIRW